jgi:hypothetical protein
METEPKPTPPEQESTQEAPQTAQETPTTPHRRKKGFMLPKYPAAPVKSLWNSASEEEKLAAHRTAVMVLEHWMGRMTRAELAKTLQLPPVRAFQLSRMALSGMVAGLLKQPKTPPKGTPLLPEEDPKRLLKRVAELERQNELLTDLLQVVRDMPTTREAMAQEPPDRKGKKNQGNRPLPKDQIHPRKPPQDQTPQAG